MCGVVRRLKHGVTETPLDAMDMKPQMHLMERLMSKSKLPNVVYHYTTASGLREILRSRVIWATDVQYLNDSAEFQYTLQLAHEHLSRIREDKIEDADLPLVEEWYQVLTAAPRVLLYVASFSVDGDSLPQWRAYSRPFGYALGLNIDHLLAVAVASPGRAAFLRCIYSQTEQSETLNYALSYLLDQYQKRKGENLGGDLLTEFGAHFFGHLLLLAGCFKHPAFEQEREWRLVIQTPAPGQSELELKARIGPRYFIPYIEVPIGTDADPLPIAKVVVGPTPDQELARQGLQALLRETRIEVGTAEFSNIPFREW